MSKVGVRRIRSLENAGTEVGEIAKAKGSALEGFNRIVAPLRESIGVRAVKSIENIGLPVLEHPSARGEFGKTKPVAGIKPFGE